MAAETSANAKAYKTAVIKIGSNTLTDDEGKCDRAYLADLAHQVARVRREGWRVIIVSSGAIPCGLEALGLPLRRPDDMPTVQAAASVGQRALLAAYDQVFSPYGMLTSLVLLTRRDTADRNAYLHARDTFRRLVELNAVPIVNENDTVSVEQIKFGDNDTLAALVACLANADRVVILSDINGLYTSNPKTDPSAQLIKRVDRITPEILAGASGAGIQPVPQLHAQRIAPLHPPAVNRVVRSSFAAAAPKMPWCARLPTTQLERCSRVPMSRMKLRRASFGSLLAIR